MYHERDLEIIRTQELAKVMDKAVSYVNIKPRTKLQVMQYLRDKGFSEDNIMETIKEMEKYHYIDDLQYAGMYFEYGFAKGRGAARIKRELSEKGVASEVIELAYDELEDVPDQLQMAMKIGESMLRGIDVASLDYDGRRKLQAKIGRRLAGRGFSSDIVYKVINSLT